MTIIDKSGRTCEVAKYIKDRDGQENIWCNDWYGHHIIGNDCEWSNIPAPHSVERPQKVLRWVAVKDWPKNLKGEVIAKTNYQRNLFAEVLSSGKVDWRNRKYEDEKVEYLLLEEFEAPAALPVEVKKIIPNKPYFVAQCEGCGFKASSEEWLGGGQIADTGDYFDAHCPVCGSIEYADADDDLYIDQRELLIQSIAQLNKKIDELEWRLYEKEQPAETPASGKDESDMWHPQDYSGRNAPKEAVPAQQGEVPEEISIWIKEAVKGIMAVEDWYNFPADFGEKVSAAMYHRDQEQIKALQCLIEDYKDVVKDKERLAKEIGDILDGDEGARQPSLCDLISPIRKLKVDHQALQSQISEYRDVLRRVRNLNNPGSRMFIIAKEALDKYPSGSKGIDQ